MTTQHLLRRAAHYPGVWLSALGISALIVALAWLGALQSGDPPPAVLVSTLDTEDIHVAAVMDDGSDALLIGHHDGVLASTDAGRTWAEDLQGLDVMALAPSVDGALFVGGHGFIGERDVDGAYVGLHPLLPDDDIHALTRSRVDPDRIWLVTGEGVLYRSTDDGASWSVTDDGPIVRVASDASAPDGVWAIDAFRGLVSSTDGGETWSDGLDVPGTPVNALATASDGSTLLLGTGVGAFLSQDRGQSWDRVLDEPVAAAAFQDNPDGTVIVFLVTPTGEVYRYH